MFKDMELSKDIMVQFKQVRTTAAGQSYNRMRVKCIYNAMFSSQLPF